MQRVSCRWAGALVALVAGCAAVVVRADEMPPSWSREPKAGIVLSDTAFRAEGVVAQRIELAPAGAPAKRGAAKPSLPDNQVGVSRQQDVAALGPEVLKARWQRLGTGEVAAFKVRSPGAVRLRVAIDLAAIPDGIEIRVAGGGTGMPQLLTASWLRETFGDRALLWTPSTAGEEQRIEVFVPAGELPAVEVRDVSHLFLDPFTDSGAEATGAVPKLLTCHQNYTCATDPTIQAAGAAVARMVYTSGGSSFVCSGSMLNDSAGVGRYFATAYHCISTQAEASSLQLGWFYDQACGGTAVSAAAVTTQGTQLLRADKGNDFTLLQVTGSVPQGVRLLGWNSAALATGTALFGVHHPAGSPKKYSAGTRVGKKTVTFKLTDADSMTVSDNVVQWSSGLTEGGSSGSPLFSTDGVFRGTLTGGPLQQSCTTDHISYYSDFSQAYPLFRQWLNPAAAVADDYPDSAAGASASSGMDSASLKVRLDSASDQDWFKFTFAEPGVWLLVARDEPGGASVDTVARLYASDGTTMLKQSDDDYGRHFGWAVHVNTPGNYYVQVTGYNGATGSFEIVSLFDGDDDHSDIPYLGTTLPVNGALAGALERGGDTDFFVLDVAQPGTVTLSSSGPTDVMGILRDANLGVVASNDDAAAGNVNFSITRSLAAGRYYLQVIGYDVATTGAYTVSASTAAAAGPNYTALWYNPAESGWGLNTNHQGDTVFATLFTYAPDGLNMWLVASGLARQADGSYSGTLYRTTGTPFFATTWSGAAVTAVGTMALRFASESSATLTYTVGSVTVNKTVQRQVFGSSVPTCTAGTGSRAAETNYQDLWYNAAEAGWGLNLVHQGTTMFGTLFIYDNTGRDMWLVASGLTRQADGSYNGPLYITSGPAFNASPFAGVQVSEAGTMRLAFSSGERGTLTYTLAGATITKSIERQTFGATTPRCR